MRSSNQVSCCCHQNKPKKAYFATEKFLQFYNLHTVANDNKNLSKKFKF